MGILTNRLFWLSLFGLLVSGGLLLAGLGYVALVVYMGLVSGTPIVSILLDLAVPLLGGIALLFIVFSLSCIALLWVLVHNASLPRNDWLGRTAERLNREYPPLRMLGFADLLSPPIPRPRNEPNRHSPS